MQDLGIDAWIAMGTVVGMFTALLLTKLRPDAVFLAAIGVLFATGVLDAKEACSGFSSTSVVVIGVLFIVVARLVNADHHVFSMKEIDDKRLLRTAYVNFGSAMIGKTIGGSTFEKDNSDFVRIGLPMNFIILAVNIFIVNIVYPLSLLSP